MNDTQDTIATPVQPNRAEIEAQRGIVRDEAGRILRSRQWKEERVAYLTEKVKDLKNRIDNAKEDIEALQAELAE